MGKTSQGIDGQVINRVGNHVFRVVKGQNIISIYQPNVANPQTPLQQQNRLKFALLSEFFGRLSEAVAAGFVGKTGHGSGYNRAVSVNFANGITGTYPNYAMNYSALKMSEGKVDLPYSPSASLDNSNLTIGWTDNSDTAAYASPEDPLALIVYNSSKHQVSTVLSAAKRNDTTFVYNCPSTWNGDDIEVYIFFRDEKLENASPSVYLGHFSL